MFAKVANENYSGRKICKWLKEIKFKSKNNKDITLGNIYRLLRMTFYYGVFEYPIGSGEWYQGKHTPIITKELFEAVQEKIKVEKKKAYGREFAFTRMLHCGYCGSGITAEEKIKELNLGDMVHFLGQVPNAKKLLSGADIFLLPSRTEAFPYTILESGFAGLPIIATSVGGIPEIICDMQNGILVHSRNPKEISEAILYFLDHPDKQKIFGSEIQKTITNSFLLEKMLKETTKLYR